MVDEEYRRRHRAGKRAVRSGGSGENETDGEQDNRRRKRSQVLDYLGVEAEVDDDDEEEGGDNNNEGADLGYEPNQRMPRPAFIPEEGEMGVDAIERRIHSFADHVTQSTEFTKPLVPIGGYELYDLLHKRKRVRNMFHDFWVSDIGLSTSAILFMHLENRSAAVSAVRFPKTIFLSNY